jgi:hypothetical protein
VSALTKPAFYVASYLLISLSIARSLVIECKSDLSLISRSIIRIIDQSLQLALQPHSAGANTEERQFAFAKDVDLEVAVRSGALVSSE